ncbi:hypothetical protein C8J57DRAFT_1217156 [Mycena rebaudengoi]|nr:hypothetical protein C8J57DRAFT_1217156 [Mycena rebaudengoi]
MLWWLFPERHKSLDLIPHTNTCWTTVNQTAVNYWLVSDQDEKPPKEKLCKGRIPAPKVAGKTLRKGKVFNVITSKINKFLMCCDLGDHRLTADYVDAGVVEAPNVLMMVRIACKIDQGMVASLHGLDYFNEAKPLDY